MTDRAHPQTLGVVIEQRKVSAQMKYKIEFLYVLFLNIVIEDGIHRYIKD